MYFLRLLWKEWVIFQLFSSQASEMLYVKINNRKKKSKLFPGDRTRKRFLKCIAKSDISSSMILLAARNSDTDFILASPLVTSIYSI